MINAYDTKEIKEEKALFELVEEVLEWNGMKIVNDYKEGFVMGQVSREEVANLVMATLLDKFKVVKK